jgi:hypothetical protein
VRQIQHSIGFKRLGWQGFHAAHYNILCVFNDGSGYCHLQN